MWINGWNVDPGPDSCRFRSWRSPGEFEPSRRRAAWHCTPGVVPALCCATRTPGCRTTSANSEERRSLWAAPAQCRGYAWPCLCLKVQQEFLVRKPSRNRVFFLVGKWYISSNDQKGVWTASALPCAVHQGKINPGSVRCCVNAGYPASRGT